MTRKQLPQLGLYNLSTFHYGCFGSGASPLLAAADETLRSRCSSLSFLRKYHNNGCQIPAAPFHRQ